MTQGDPAALPPISPGRAWGTLALLATLYIISYVDRGVLALLVQPLKADLGLDDLDISLLYGTAFAVFYSLLGIPVARLADRSNRHRLIVAGVVLWGVSTVASGFAETFAMLIVLRIGLAVGEAALTPATFSMIADIFPAERRPLAASSYKAVGTLGVGGGMIAVGTLIHFLATRAETGAIATGFKVWQLVMIAVGLPALVLGGIFALLCREPIRRQEEPNEGASNRDLLAYFSKRRGLYVGLFAGAGLMQVVAGIFPAWGPEFMRRTYQWDVQQVATTMGTLVTVTGILSTLSGPIVTRVLERHGRNDAVFIIAIVSCIVGTILAVAAYQQANVWIFIPLYILSAFFMSGGSANILFLIPNLVPARMVGTFVCVLISVFNLFALGIGPPMTALISSHLSADGLLLNKAIAWQSLACGAIGVVLLCVGWAAFHASTDSEEKSRPIRFAFSRTLVPLRARWSRK